MDAPFKQCPTCGTPQVKKTKALVLYFATDEDLAEFVEIFNEAKPNATAYPVPTTPDPEDAG